MLQLKNFNFGYKDKIQINETFFSENVYFLLGPNGSGKTSFLKSLLKDIPYHSGEINLQGGALQTTDISFLPALLEFHPLLQIQDLAEIYDLSFSSWKSQSLTRDLHLQNFSQNLSLKELSSGQTQRLFLSFALSSDKKIFLLDEPLNYLEWKYRAVLQKQISLLQSQKKIVFIISHDLQWPLEFQNSHALVFSPGKTLYFGPSHQAYLQPEVQNLFQFRAQITDNPIDHKPLLALATQDEQRQ